MSRREVVGHVDVQFDVLAVGWIVYHIQHETIPVSNPPMFSLEIARTYIRENNAQTSTSWNTPAVASMQLPTLWKNRSHSESPISYDHILVIPELGNT